MTTGEQTVPEARAHADPEVAPRRASMSRIAVRSWQFVGVVLAAVALGWVLQKVVLVVVAVVLAVMISATMTPMMRPLTRWGWPPTVAALAVTFTWISVFTILLFLVGWRVADQVPELVVQLGRALEQLRQQYPFLPIAEDGAADQLISRGRQLVTSRAAASLQMAAEVTAGGLLTVVLSFFFLRDGGGMWHWFVDKFDEPRRRRVNAMGRAGYGTLSEYVRGLAVIAAADAIFSAIGLFALGVPLALALAVLTFIGGFVPTVGAFVAGGLAVASAFVAGGSSLAVIVLILYVAIQQLDGTILQPWIMGRRLPLHPAAVLVALTVGGLVAGIVGGLLAVPLTAMIVAATSEYLNPGTYRPPLW